MIEDRWNQGYQDAMRALDLAPWTQPVHEHTGVVVHRMLMHHDGPPAPGDLSGRVEARVHVPVETRSGPGPRSQGSA
jgi:hypothetical protein